jgi:uncharacterized protein
MSERAPGHDRPQRGPVISAELLELLVCPVDKSELRLVESNLVCTACQRVYPIEGGIPRMMVESEK